MGLGLFAAKRLVRSVIVVLAVIVLSFFLLRLAPGDPATLMAGEGASREYLELIRREFGLDRPLPEQFSIYMSKVVVGDLGLSQTFKRPVLVVILERLPQTILLVGTGLTLAILIGIGLGIVAAKKPYSIRDNVITGGSLLFYSIPIFWLAQLLILGLAVYVRLFPAGGIYSIGAQLTGLSFALDVAWHLSLPAITIAGFFLAIYARLTRAGLLEALRMNFIVAARAKGVPERLVLYRHALKNALLPIITVAGIQFGLMVGGLVLTETVFAWPGIGSLLIDAVFFRDYPLVMGIFILTSISVVVASFLTDLLYARIDPRIVYT